MASAVKTLVIVLVANAVSTLLIKNARMGQSSTVAENETPENVVVDIAVVARVTAIVALTMGEVDVEHAVGDR